MQTARRQESLTRRHFLKLMAIGTSAMAGAGILAACQPSAPAPASTASKAESTRPPAAAATQAPAGQPTKAPAAPTQNVPAVPTQAATQAAAKQAQKGGTYRVLGAGDIRSLDPGGAESSEDWWSAAFLLYNTLYIYDRNGKFLPDLAADLPKVSQDGLTYTIPVRKGVKFHDGSEMTAEDVAFSLAWQLWPDVYSWGKSYMSNLVGFDEVTAGKSKELSGVKVVDPATVQVTLKKPQAVFPALLSMSMNSISPKKAVLEAGKDWGTKVIVGTGPFKFKEWQRGQKAVYERNPSYFKPQFPYLDRVELYLNVDPSVQMLRFESNQAEFIHDIPAAELPRVITDQKYKSSLLRIGTTNCVRLGFHFGTKPFDDTRVRQAIGMAIDKQAIVKKFSGTVTPLEGFFVPSMLQFDKGFKSKFPYDPGKAKELLSTAGLASGIKGIKMYTGIGDTKTLGELIQADLRSIGVEVELAVGQWKEWRDKIRAGEVPLFIYGWAASFLDAADYTSAWTTCAAIKDGYNDGKYCNQKIDELYDAAEKMPLDDPKRIANYRQIEDIVINQDAAWVGLENPQQLSLGKDYAHDVSLEFLVGWPRLEQVWMEKR